MKLEIPPETVAVLRGLIHEGDRKLDAVPVESKAVLPPVPHDWRVNLTYQDGHASIRRRYVKSVRVFCRNCGESFTLSTFNSTFDCEQPAPRGRSEP